MDQLMYHVKHLKRFSMQAQDLPETDRLNVLELASRIMEEQEEPVMQELMLNELGSKSTEEPTQDDERLINAVVRSGLTQLNMLRFDNNASWFGHSEMNQYLMEFIQEQTCL